MNKRTVYAIVFLLGSVMFIAGGYLYQNNSLSVVDVATDDKKTASSTPTFAAISSPDSERGGVAIIPITDTPAPEIPMPDYKRPLTFPANSTLTPEAKAALLKTYAKNQAALIKDPNQFNEWVFLGNDHLIAGNYAVAREFWEYVSAKWPQNTASHNNLGDLYMNYLKDYAKAEREFLAAIQNKPSDQNPYRNLFTLYSETSYKPTNTAAEDLLKRYLANEPKAYDMQVLLARYYVKMGKTPEAKAAFEAAAKSAEQQNNITAAQDIRAEAAAL